MINFMFNLPLFSTYMELGGTLPWSLLGFSLSFDVLAYEPVMVLGAIEWSLGLSELIQAELLG